MTASLYHSGSLERAGGLSSRPARTSWFKAPSIAGLRLSWTAVIDLRQLGQSFGQVRAELALDEPPPPIAFGRAGQVHPRRGSQPQDVLQGNDGRVGDRGQSQADHVPVNLVAIGAEIIKGKGPLGVDLRGRAGSACAGLAVEPAAGGVVV